MEIVGARFGRKVHVHRCGSAVLTRVRVVHDRYFLNLVLPEHVVARTGVVQVVIGIVHVAAVDGVKVGSSRHAKSGEVSVTRAGAQRNPWRRQRVVRQIPSRVRNILDQIRSVGRGEISVLRLQDRFGCGDFHDL